MAEIFRGRALAAGGFEKPVAIKRILPHLCQDQSFVELLIAEAKVLSMLRHRNIVQIFDVGLGDDGQYFLVMEFVNGLDLGKIQTALESKRRLLQVDLGLHIGAEVCEALEHAHVANDPDGRPMRLVHRDISPSNVLISRAGEVKLTDFGIAKRAEEVTGHGTVRGKFAYISPEQARNEHVDARSDVFSLGIVLFELLTGCRLFSALPDLEALFAVRESKIPRPRELDGNLPIEVDELLGKALARDPARRFSSAGEFGAALRSLRYSLEIASGDPSAELARVVESAESSTAHSVRGVEFETSEATVIRIRTAAAFSMNDSRIAFSQARQVINRFEEEETRQSKLGPDTLRDFRHSHQSKDPPPLQDHRARSLHGHTTSLSGDEPTAFAGPMTKTFDVERTFDAEEETIARGSPIRAVAPTTLKRVPPGIGPGSSLPAVRVPMGVGAPTVDARPPSMMPDVKGWEPVSYRAPEAALVPEPAMFRPPPREVPNPAAMGPALSVAPAPGYVPHSPERSFPAVSEEPARLLPAQTYPPRPPMVPQRSSRSWISRAAESGMTDAERWRTAALVLGAIVMAVLAFAVTRSCLHQDPPKALEPVVGPPESPAK